MVYQSESINDDSKKIESKSTFKSLVIPNNSNRESEILIPNIDLDHVYETWNEKTADKDKLLLEEYKVSWVYQGS
jgi:hypothetical protein